MILPQNLVRTSPYVRTCSATPDDDDIFCNNEIVSKKKQFGVFKLNELFIFQKKTIKKSFQLKYVLVEILFQIIISFATRSIFQYLKTHLLVSYFFEIYFSPVFIPLHMFKHKIHLVAQV